MVEHFFNNDDRLGCEILKDVYQELGIDTDDDFRLTALGARNGPDFKKICILNSAIYRTHHAIRRENRRISQANMKEAIKDWNTYNLANNKAKKKSSKSHHFIK